MNGDKAAFQTAELTNAGFALVDEGVETVQHGHLLLSYVAGSGDGWLRARFTVVNDTPAPNAMWWFSSCKITPLAS